MHSGLNFQTFLTIYYAEHSLWLQPGLHENQLSIIQSPMQMGQNQTRSPLRSAVEFAIFTALFAIAYAQSPLYTSNQNQYFLHGLARAGVGYLKQDWLANTLDPTPVFSTLVEFTFRLTRLEALFYLYYALLMGVYLFSLLGIGVSLFNPANGRQKNVASILFASMLIVIHSAALRFILSRTLSENWSYIIEDGVADQRILGPVFQPSVFGVLLIASISLVIHQRPYLAILSAVLAATFHPTYLLSAAVLTVLYMFLAWKDGRSLGKIFTLGATALIFVSPILYYAFDSFGGSSPEVAAQAREILASYRIPHHARIDQWLDATVAVKIALLLAALYLSRRSRVVFSILLGSSLIVVLLTAIQALLGSDFLALVFPWRLSIYILPLSTTIILAAITARISASPLLRSSTWVNTLKILSGAAILVAVVVGAVRFKLDLDRKAQNSERALFTFVYAHKQPEDLYLTPVKMQDFRLESGAPVFVDFKSIPYKDADVLEWYRRVQVADDFYKSEDCEVLRSVITREKITHVVVETNQIGSKCSFTNVSFQDQYLTLLQIVPAGNLLVKSDN